MEKTDKQEILEAIQGLDKKIDGVELRLGQRLDGVEHRLSGQIDFLAASVLEVKDDIGELHEAVNEFSSETDRRFTRIEVLMVTKDYLDRKLPIWQEKVMKHVKARVTCWTERGVQGTA